MHPGTEYACPSSLTLQATKHRSARMRQQRREGKRNAPTFSTPSVLLSDPKAIFRFAEHAVVLPVVVIAELEGKRQRPRDRLLRAPGPPQPRRAARPARASRLPDRRSATRGGSLRVELNHSNMCVLPSGLQLGDNDSRILAVALNLASDGLDVTVVSKDLPLRVKAASIGLAAEEYRAELAVDSGWTGQADITLSSEQMNELYDDEKLSTRLVQDLPVNTGLVLHSDRGSALGRVTSPRPAAARARRPRRVRPARPQRRAAPRHRPAARPRDRHRLARRPRRNRQVGARALRRPRGRAREAAAPQDHGLPPALRGRRPGARLPARRRAARR